MEAHRGLIPRDCKPCCKTDRKTQAHPLFTPMSCCRLKYLVAVFVRLSSRVLYHLAVRRVGGVGLLNQFGDTRAGLRKFGARASSIGRCSNNVLPHRHFIVDGTQSAHCTAHNITRDTHRWYSLARGTARHPQNGHGFNSSLILSPPSSSTFRPSRLQSQRTYARGKAALLTRSIRCPQGA